MKKERKIKKKKSQAVLLKKLRKDREHLGELRKKYDVEVRQILDAKRGWCGCEGYASCSGCYAVGQGEIIPLVLERFEKQIREEIAAKLNKIIEKGAP